MGALTARDPRDENPLIPSGPEGSSGMWDLSGAAGISRPEPPYFIRTLCLRVVATGLDALTKWDVWSVGQVTPLHPEKGRTGMVLSECIAVPDS